MNPVSAISAGTKLDNISDFVNDEPIYNATLLMAEAIYRLLKKHVSMEVGWQIRSITVQYLKN